MPQTTVRFDYGFGVVGESRKHGSRRAKPGLINSGTAANNVVGRAFTQAAAGGTVAAGGTGIFFGLLANPKQYASYGTAAGGPLAPTITLANQTIGEFVESDYSFIVAMTNANVGIGDYVCFSQTDGSLQSVAPGSAVPTGYTRILGAVVDDLPQPTAGGLCTISLTGPLSGGPAGSD
jgi:hypothetical protein